MAYKKYIKRGKKIYGPYIYHSRKVNGKVISEYQGKYEDKKNSKRKQILTFLIIALVIFSLIIGLNYNKIDFNQGFKTTKSILNNIITPITKSLTGFVIVENETIVNESQIILGHPVKWKKYFLINSTNNSIKLPEEAEKIRIKKINSENIILSFIEDLALTGRVIDNENNEIILDELGEYEINYETPAPHSVEENIENGKRVRIIGPETIHYQNVLSFTELDENLNVVDPSSVRIYWLEEDRYVPIETIEDTNNNGIYDYIEWFTPHLSEQTFDIIVITKAEHLDSNRQFISDIYNEVKALDDIWSETISDGDYVRVTFEQELDSSRDITIYPKIVLGEPRIEVYEVGGSEIIAEFTDIVSNEYNKVLLTNLIGEQDSFDLRVVNGDVQIDHVVDPEVTVNFTSSGSWVVPAGVTSITVRAWGAGGGGGGGSGATNGLGGGGGAGGQYAQKVLSVTLGENYTVTIGNEGVGGVKDVNGTAGGDTIFNNSLVVAKGGDFGRTHASGAAGGLGSTSGGNGTVVYQGGNGANGGTGSGGGGGGAGTTGAGGNALTQTGGTGTSLYGGDGGAGKSGNNLAGDAGSTYGGAGGGGTGKTGGGGNGAQGFLQIIYEEVDNPPTWSNPSVDNPTPNPGVTVNHNVYWQDDKGLSYATLEVNSSGVNCDTTANVTNTSLSGASSWANLTWTVPNACEGKIISWIQYANDSINQWNVTSLQTYTVNNIPPQIQFVAPTEANETPRSRTWIFANVTLVEDNFKNVTFKLFNSTGLLNETTYTTEILQINWTNLDNNNVQYWYNASTYDTAGNFNETETRYITLTADQPPTVTILYPQNTTYKDVTQLNYSATDDNPPLSHCWYSLNGGTTNSSPNPACSNYTSLISIEGSNNWTVYANDSTNQIGSDIVFFTKDTTPPTIEFLSQAPTDIDSFIIFTYYLNISYNITDSTGVNASTVKIYYKTNSTTSDIFIYENGTSVSGYHTGGETASNISEIWNFSINDNEIYPATYNFDEDLIRNITHLAYDLDSKKEYIKTRFFNVSNQKNYSILEIYVDNQTANSNALRIYYCNSSYSGDPAGNVNCINFYNLEASTPFNHSHTENSIHYAIPFTMNLSTGEIGDIYVTNTSYFLFRGLTSLNAWNIYYITNISRPDTIQISTNNGGAWSNFSGTTDVHLHQYDGSDVSWYYVCANDTLENENCAEGTARYDLIDLAGIPPIAPEVYNPIRAFYSGNITINYTASLSPNSYPISFYNISLVDLNETYNMTIKSNNSLNLSYIWDSTNAVDGEYYIRVEACDNLSQCSFGYSENITLDNSPPNINFTDPTPDNASSQTANAVYVNVSTSDANNHSAWIDWNRSLVGWWSFDFYNDTGIFDNSTYDNFGIFQGGLNTSNITNGIRGKALEFDGVDNYVYSEPGGNLDNIFNNGGTIIVWVYPRSAGENSYGRIVDKSTNTDSYGGYSIQMDSDDNSYRLEKGFSSQRGVWYTDPSSLVANAWNYIAVVYNDSSDINKPSLYVNGVNVSYTEQTAPSGNSDSDVNQNFTIGNHANASTRTFDGLIDEVMAFDRALSPEEVNASYNAGLYKLYRNFTGLDNAIYDYTAYTIDAGGNTNKTEQRTVIIAADIEYPQFSNYARAPSTPNEDQDVQVNVTITETNLDTVILEWNGTTNYTVSTNVSNEYYFTILQGNYTAHESVTYYWYANDTANNLNKSTQQGFTVANQIPSVDAPAINDTTPETNDLISCDGGTFSDNDAEDIEQARYFKWYDTNVEVSGQTSQTLDLSVSGLDKGDVIKCSVRVYDGYDNSSWTNSSNTATIQNSPPIITNPQTTVNKDADGTPYNYDYEATDPDSGDSFTWYDNTTLFDINSGTGIISDTPTESEAGIYSILINVSDGTDQDTDTFTYTINDITSPSIDFASPTETDDSQLTRDYIRVNVTASDVNDIGTITLRLYNSTSLVQTNTSSTSPLFVNFTNLPDENYYFNATVNDTYGNTNQTETRTVSTDTGPPTMNYVSPTQNPGAYKSQNYIEVNVTAGDPNLDKIVIRLYNSAHTQINSTITSSSPNFANFTGLSNGLYYYNATANDTFGNEESLTTRNITLDTIVPLIDFTTGTEDPDTTFARDWIFVNITVTEDNEDTITFSLYNQTALVNETSYTDSTREINWTNLPNEIYYYNVTVNDTAGNSNNTETRKIILDTEGPLVSSLTESPDDPATYSEGGIYMFNATVTDPSLDTVWVDFNGINYTATNIAGNIYNITLINLGIGIYDYRWYANDSFSNLNDSENGTYTITQGIPSLSITITPSNNVDYGTETTADGTGCPSQLTCNLYRNDTGEITPPDVVTLGVGVYNYTYNTTGNANYTGASVSDILTINQATGIVFTYLNNSQSNITIEQYTEIYLNSTLETGQAGDNIKLYNNGSLIEQGASPLSNLTNFTTIGLYNITTIYDGNENYSSAFETWWVNVTEFDVTPPQISIIYPENISYNEIQTQLNYTAWDNFGLNECWYSLNNGITNTTIICGQNKTGLNSGQGSSTWTVYANDSKGNENSSSVTFFVDSINPTINFVTPTETNGTTFGRNYIQVNTTANDTNLDTITIYLYNSTSLVQTNISITSPFFINYTGLSAETYYFNATANDTIGNNISTETRTVSLVLPNLTIIKPENETYITKENLPLDYSASYEDYVWYNIDQLGSNTTIFGNTTFNVSSEVGHTLYLYANNTLGIISKNVTFTANTTKFTVKYNNYTGTEKGNSTDFNASSFEDLQNLSDVILEDIDYGKISFNETINMTDDANLSDNKVDLDFYTNISLNHIEINTTALPNLNKSATLYLYNLSFSNPRILRNNEICSSDICAKESYSSSTLKFTVTQFTFYSAEETPVEPATPSGPEGVGGAGECFNDSECEGEEICWNYVCVKLFDVKIIDFESPAKLGDFFDFTYFIKGMANINDDVEVRFWIEKDGKKVSSGSDVIYLGSFEEKTETTKIFLPSNVRSGIYDFYVEVFHRDYTAKSHRTIEIQVREGIAIISPIDTKGIGIFVLIFALFLFVLILFIIFRAERKKIKKFLIKDEKWIKKHKLSVIASLLIIILVVLLYLSNLFEPIINLVLRISLWFKLQILPNLIYIIQIILIIILLIIFFIIAHKKKWLEKLEIKRKKRKKKKLIKKKYKAKVRKVKAEVKKVRKAEQRPFIRIKRNIKSMLDFLDEKISLGIKRTREQKRIRKRKRESIRKKRRLEKRERRLKKNRVQKRKEKKERRLRIKEERRKRRLQIRKEKLGKRKRGRRKRRKSLLRKKWERLKEKRLEKRRAREEKRKIRRLKRKDLIKKRIPIILKKIKSKIKVLKSSFKRLSKKIPEVKQTKIDVVGFANKLRIRIKKIEKSLRDSLSEFKKIKITRPKAELPRIIPKFDFKKKFKKIKKDSEKEFGAIEKEVYRKAGEIRNYIEKRPDLPNLEEILQKVSTRVKKIKNRLIDGFFRLPNKLQRPIRNLFRIKLKTKGKEEQKIIKEFFSKRVERKKIERERPLQILNKIGAGFLQILHKIRSFFANIWNAIRKAPRKIKEIERKEEQEISKEFRKVKKIRLKFPRISPKSKPIIPPQPHQEIIPKPTVIQPQPQEKPQEPKKLEQPQQEKPQEQQEIESQRTKPEKTQSAEDIIEDIVKKERESPNNKI